MKYGVLVVICYSGSAVTFLGPYSEKTAMEVASKIGKPIRSMVSAFIATVLPWPDA